MVRILALETSTQRGDIAILEDGLLVDQRRLDSSEMSAKSLIPAVSQALAAARLKSTDLDLLAVALGPGSFTGLRVGVTIAKTMAYTSNAAILGVDTLRAVAAGSQTDNGIVAAVIDAQRNQIFVQTFFCSAAGHAEPTGELTIKDVDSWLEDLPRDLPMTGPGLARIAPRLPTTVRVVDPTLWTPTAETVGRLARLDYERGVRHDHWSLTPRYGRPSAAEEKIQPSGP